MEKVYTINHDVLKNIATKIKKSCDDILNSDFDNSEHVKHSNDLVVSAIELVFAVGENFAYSNLNKSNAIKKDYDKKVKRQLKEVKAKVVSQKAPSNRKYVRDARGRFASI